jgi:2-polyprenyl-3-methyl-5-hydroxy-6-metoxy-1,4-benzoquinol methylase
MLLPFVLPFEIIMAIPQSQLKHYPESAFGAFTRVDGTIAFFSRVNSLLSPTANVLDVGCGRGEYVDDSNTFRRGLRVLRGKCALVLGIDVDPIGEMNGSLDAFRLIDSPRWPVEDNSIDVCVCDHVVEHVEDIEMFFSECSRVVRPGGYICIRTPNAWSYLALASRLVPNKYHSQVLNKVQFARLAQDVFPTLYRCNTVGSMTRQLRRSGFSESCVYTHDPEPAYLNFSAFAYRLGVWHQKLAPAPFKTVLFGLARRDPVAPKG